MYDTQDCSMYYFFFFLASYIKKKKTSKNQKGNLWLLWYIFKFTIQYFLMLFKRQ